MGKLKTIWTDPVWSKVIAQGIIAAVVFVAAILLVWWPPALAFTLRVAGFLAATSEVSNWIIGVGVICTLLVTAVIGAVLWSRFFSREEVESWRAYTSDNFEGLRWHWRYASTGEILSLFALCNKCLYQVEPRNVSAFRAVPQFIFYCDVCKCSVGPFDGEPSELEGRITRLIHRNLRVKFLEPS